MTHPYLNFSDSNYGDGLVVGTSDETTEGNGLTNKSVFIIDIPRTFSGKNVIEIGYQAFNDLDIEYVFIPKYVKKIGYQAFRMCYKLTEIRFEEGSQLESIGKDAFSRCNRLQKLDIPASVNEIEYDSSNWLFYRATGLRCISYLGTTNFAENPMFDSSSPEIHVATNYPSDKFGQLGVSYEDGSTCEVKKVPFLRCVCVCMRAMNLRSHIQQISMFIYYKVQ